MKSILNSLNDFWVAFAFFGATTIGYALGGIPYMVSGMLVSLMLIPILYSSSSIRNPDTIARYFGSKDNYLRITKGLFYAQGVFVGAIFGWHISTTFFFS